MILNLKSIKNNPFRDLGTNPLMEEKITELKASINLTGFWENIVVRKNKQGSYELAYGHHRLQAAIRAGIVEADFIVKEFDDAKMIQVMDSENRETYGSTPLSLIESVKAVVGSLAKGTIPPFVVDSKVRPDTLRYAPFYTPGVGGTSPQMAYTTMHIAEFLGRTESKGRVKGRPEEIRRKPEDAVVAALNFLQLKEKGRVTDSILVDKDRNNGIRSITVNELLHRTTDIKRDVERVEQRVAKTKEEVAKADAEQRKVQAEARARQDAEEKKQKALLEKLAEAKREENAKQVQAIKAKLEAEKAAAAEKETLDKIRISEIDAKVEAAKEKAAEQAKVDEYAPLAHETDRLVRILNRRDEEEAVKAHARKNLNNNDRERLRQAAIAKGTWYMEWVAMQFLPPLSSKKQMDEYRKREASKRRVEEAKQEQLAAKKEKRGKSK